jgi:hypothetical protein
MKKIGLLIELKNGAAQVAEALVSTRMKSVSDSKSYDVLFDLAGDTRQDQT